MAHRVQQGKTSHKGKELEMRKYIVKETSKATTENQNFAGETLTYYFGKGGMAIAREGTHLPYDNFDRTEYMLAEYGYNRKCDAVRSYAYKHPENSKFWASTVEIIEVEC